ncbi:MAG: hypothetical protein EPN97_18440 [Alphaproteobacteria bacterium]|nr:MAG: hypothetical protein EPN97_18440 [Alphaproteobacteria bacterium]
MNFKKLLLTAAFAAAVAGGVALPAQQTEARATTTAAVVAAQPKGMPKQAALSASAASAPDNKAGMALAVLLPVAFGGFVLVAAKRMMPS